MSEPLLQGLQALIRDTDPKGTVSGDEREFTARFVNNGEAHQVRLRYIPPKQWEMIHSVAIPGAKARWFLESKWVWFPEKSGASKASLPPLDQKYKLFASDEKFLREVFSEPKLVDQLMAHPQDEHVKENLKDGVLTANWKVHVDPRTNDRDAVLLNRITLLFRHGLELAFSVQMARLTAGELSKPS